MIYFIRAKTHFKYALSLWEDLQQGKVKPNLTLYRDIFLQGLKALYAITVADPNLRPKELAEILPKVLPTLTEEQKKLILRLKELLFSKQDTIVEEDLKEDFISFFKILEECLKPIL